jgi:excisionase family DNA binding protein
VARTDESIGSADAVLSVSEAADFLDVSDRRVRQLIEGGVLPARQTSHGWVIERAAVEARSKNHHRAGRPPAARTAWAILDELAAITPAVFAHWLLILGDGRPNRHEANTVASGAQRPIPAPGRGEREVDADAAWLMDVNLFPWDQGEYASRVALQLLGVGRSINPSDEDDRWVARRARRVLAALDDPRLSTGPWAKALRNRASVAHMWTDKGAATRLAESAGAFLAGVRGAVRAGAHLAEGPTDLLDVYLNAADRDAFMQRFRLQQVPPVEAVVRLHVIPRDVPLDHPRMDSPNLQRVVSAADLLDSHDPRERRAAVAILGPAAAVASAAAKVRNSPQDPDRRP